MTIYDEFESRKRMINTNPYFNEFIDKYNEYINFLTDLDFLIGTRNIETIIIDDKYYIINTYLLSSSTNTLYSIKICCEYGYFSDANVLIRKFRDDIFFYLYLLEIQNIQNDLSNGINNNIKMKNNYNEQLKYIKQWFENKLKAFYFNKNIISYLKNNKDINEIINKFNLEKVWNEIFKTLNNYVHNNGKRYCKMNYDNFDAEEIEKYLKDIIYEIDYIISVFLVLLIIIKPYLIISNDYTDYFECDLKPPEDSQYIIAPFIQRFIDEHIIKLKPDLKKFLQEKIYMKIE